ncbi:hypothetical protein CGZ94_04900 [Enemella evansiae]|uniref:Uncharacterized protein n=1 Tax=Enemella evansiae TaxID=2016499 RepID=A0A255GL32_9ACTN|nr:hypothetical protein [Enemella evansiae]OYO16281.1 hypothetical protein CGZ94_04900 [Enemella evansiae]
MTLDLTDLTQVAATDRWITANQGWLEDSHLPMVAQLRTLAATMDTDLASKGKVQSATASTYRGTFETLMRLKPTKVREKEAWEEDGTLGAPADDDGLLGPRDDL